MKKLLFAIIVFTATAATAQTTSHERDSVAQTIPFKTKVKMASHKAANDLLADTTITVTVRRYAQMIISEPDGSWVIALSYGCMTNPAVNANSTDNDIQFTINSIFVKYAKAYYRE